MSSTTRFQKVLGASRKSRLTRVFAAAAVAGALTAGVVATAAPANASTGDAVGSLIPLAAAFL